MPTPPATKGILLAMLSAALASCLPSGDSAGGADGEPGSLRPSMAAISFVTIPVCGEGPDQLALASGIAAGAPDGAAVVLYAQSTGGNWFVQPFRGDERYLTPIANGQWEASIHLGWSYAALLVAPDFRLAPETPAEVTSPPFEQGGVLAHAITNCAN